MNAKTAPVKRGWLAEVKLDLTIILGFIALLWGLEFIDELFWGNALNQYGLVPRTGWGLLGILTSPLLHGDFDHLTANSSALVVLAFLIALRRRRNLFLVTGVTWILGGFCVWLMGRQAIHIGASGIVFGYLGYLLTRGLFEKKLVPIVGAISVFLIYGSALFGVLPGQRGISWEGHLFGLLSGIAAARFIVWLERRQAARGPRAAARPVQVRRPASPAGR